MRTRKEEYVTFAQHLNNVKPADNLGDERYQLWLDCVMAVVIVLCQDNVKADNNYEYVKVFDSERFVEMCEG